MSSMEMNIEAMLTEQVQRLFSDRIDRDAWIHAEEGRLDANLWREVQDMGITLAMCREELGGAGLGWAASEASLRLLGAHACPAPVGEALLSGWLLDQADLEVPQGILTLSDAEFRLDSNGRLHGTDSALPWLPVASHVVLGAKRGNARYLCLLSADQGQRAVVDTLDRLPCARYQLDGVLPLQMVQTPTLGELGLRPYLATLRSIQIAGALNQVLDLCVEYANTRIQFGKPIGKFQAIQQMIAELAAQAAAAQVAGLYAARQIDAGNSEQGAAVAKSLVGRSATRAAAIAHQVFGAIGVTDEHSLHYYTRRLWQWRADAGSEHWWSERLGQQTLQSEGANLWTRITATL